jgi:hypothetical protein
MTERERREWDNAYREHGRLQTLERQIRLKNLELERNKAPASAQPNSGKQSSGNKGPREGTLAAGAAVHRYLSDNSCDRNMTAAELARLATDYAVRLSFPDADLLDPQGSTMLKVAARLLEAHRHVGK